MTRAVGFAADRIAPWRGADWRVVIAEGILLVLGGAYFLVDGERAEFILGIVVSAAMIVDGAAHLDLPSAPACAELIAGWLGEI